VQTPFEHARPSVLSRTNNASIDSSQSDKKKIEKNEVSIERTIRMLFAFLIHQWISYD